jgi:hypothetical protein
MYLSVITTAHCWSGKKKRLAKAKGDVPSES